MTNTNWLSFLLYRISFYLMIKNVSGCIYFVIFSIIVIYMKNENTLIPSRFHSCYWWLMKLSYLTYISIYNIIIHIQKFVRTQNYCFYLMSSCLSHQSFMLRRSFVLIKMLCELLCLLDSYIFMIYMCFVYTFS